MPRLLQIIMIGLAAYLAVSAFGVMREAGVEAAYAIGIMVASGVGYYHIAAGLLRDVFCRPSRSWK